MHKFDLHSCNITEKHQTTNEAPPQHLTTEMDEMQGWMEMILCDYPSPGLNPIENLWTQFQDAVAKSDPRTTDEFKKVLKAAWWAIDQDRIRCFYNSMPQRLEAVVANGGKWTKY